MNKMLTVRKIIENSQISAPLVFNIIRGGHTLRGKPPGVARSLQQRLADENVVDPILSQKINIGFPQLKPPRSEELSKRLEYLKKQRNNPELEKLAKSGKLEIDLEDVENEWLKTSGPHHIRTVAEQYKVYEHLFGDAYFIPRVPLDIKFQFGEYLVPVYYGNLMKPEETQEAPDVTYDASFSMTGKPLDPKETKKTLWTLLMTNPDGHLEKENSEYVHWLVSNIPSNEVPKGECLVPYLQPFPPRGTGYHRHIFVLFKQEKKLDLSKYKVTEPFNLDKRTFNTLDFYRELQDDITPAGLAFFQADYDDTLTDFFHHKLNMKEPTFQYDWAKPYIQDQRWFPLKKPFNLYMDKYRDQKQVAKEFLERKLAKTHPFDGPEAPLKYPNAHPIKGVPSWWKTEIKKARLGWGRINEYNQKY